MSTRKNMRILASILIGLAILAQGGISEACTLWAASGDRVAGGGTLLIKNRDWFPTQQQKIKLYTPKKGYRYVGLLAEGPSGGVKAGVNEKGLVVVSATAGSIPRSEREKMPSSQPAGHLLRECSSVDEALTRNDIFKGPVFLMISDKNKVAYIEIGPEGAYSTKVEPNGVLYHSNHYIDESMQAFNKKVGKSSLTRYHRIGQLLDAYEGPFTEEDFWKFTEDQHDGPDNSIFRTGHGPESERTMATWSVAIKPDGTILLHTKLFNANHVPESLEVKVNDIFSGKVKLEKTPEQHHH